MDRRWESIALSLICGVTGSGCGGEQPSTLEESLNAQPGFWFEARLDPEEAQRLRALAAAGYLDGYEPAPPVTGITVHERERAVAGVNLYSSGHAPEALLIDMGGALLQRWSREYQTLEGVPAMEHPTQAAWRRVRLLPNGELLALHEGLALIKLDRDSEVMWTFGGHAHHDIHALPDGRIATLTRSPRLIPELNPDEPVLEDHVALLTAQGELLAEVSVVQCLLRSRWGAEVRREGHRGGDFLHTNSVRILGEEQAAMHAAFNPGNALVCLRELHAFAVLDLEAQRAVWLKRGPWRAPHDVRLLPGGRAMAFDNMGHQGYSRVVEFDLDSGELAWSFAGDPPASFFSVFCGAAQRLDGGNTLVTETCNGRAMEVTPAGEVVWAFVSPHRAGPADELVAALFEVTRLDPAALPWLPR